MGVEHGVVAPMLSKLAAGGEGGPRHHVRACLENAGESSREHLGRDRTRTLLLPHGVVAQRGGGRVGNITCGITFSSAQWALVHFLSGWHPALAIHT